MALFYNFIHCIFETIIKKILIRSEMVKYSTITVIFEENYFLST